MNPAPATLASLRHYAFVLLVLAYAGWRYALAALLFSAAIDALVDAVYPDKEDMLLSRMWLSFMTAALFVGAIACAMWAAP